jgi:hypothetical protein
MLLALDISTTQTGYCVGVPTMRPRYGVFRPKQAMSREERIYFTACCVAQAVKGMVVTKVVAEAVSVGGWVKKDGTKGAGSLMSAVALAEAHGAIRNELWRCFKLRMENFNLASARSQLGIRQELGIKGAPGKADVRRWLKNQGYPTVNDDEADALAIWLALCMGKTGTTISQPGLKVRA